MKTSALAALALAFALGGAWMAWGPMTAVLPGAALAQDAEPAADEPDAAEVAAIPDMVLGDADAPVTLIEYASFTCPHCAAFHADQFGRLKADYIDTGKVRFVYREVFFDRFGLWASLIARCGEDDPSRFFAVSDLLYEGQREWIGDGDPATIAENLRTIGRTAGLDDAALDACLKDEGEAQALLEWFQANAEADGVDSTPTLVIDGDGAFQHGLRGAGRAPGRRAGRVSGPLEGLRVLELARILAGPWAGQLLADMGAEVVKVEAPEGDDTRRWGPPFIGKDAAYFHACNRGKSSVVADFGTQEGRATVCALARESDVVIENFKVGGLDRHGLGYEALSALNPRLVWCSITGFGQDGPRAAQAGYDALIQAMSGLMSLTGEPDREPQKVGVAVVDLFTGVYATAAILAALRHRDATGRGQRIDMALLDVAVAMSANQGMNYLATGVAPHRMGNAHPNIVPYQVLPCADGPVMVAVGNDAQFRRFLALLGLPEDPAHATNPQRLADREALVVRLSERTRAMTRAALVAACEAAGVPAGPINDLAEALADPQAVHRGMRIAPGGVPGLRSPLRFSETPLALDRPAPRLGEG
jgi:crotonobetainyl-CoA:carnitine CoA-transferase CaiB-like acyl-CoA transferase/protein-disulfide isomerase